MSRVWGDELDAFMSSSSSTLGPYDDLPARADVIIVLDNSYSMRGRLQRGKAILRYKVRRFSLRRRVTCRFARSRRRYLRPLLAGHKCFAITFGSSVKRLDVDPSSEVRTAP